MRGEDRRSPTAAMGSWALRFLLSSALLGGASFGDLEADGGWHTDHATQMVGKGSCNVEVRDSLTYSEFIHRYAYSRPVILRGFTQNEHFRALCSKQRLLQKFGNHLVRLSTANTYSYQKVDVPFKEYVEHIMKPQSLDSLGSDTLYFFGDNNFTEWDSLFRTYIQPPYQLPGTKAAYSFGIAGSGTGVPFHWHGAGYSEVLYGRKRWFLYPPDKTPKFHPNRTTLSWMLDTYPYLPEMDKPLECTIHPGEDEHKVKSHGFTQSIFLQPSVNQ
ncbi:jmjC domain-containing protein 8 isoform X2 [Hemitrygon akajei]|uniref:jmjC domain-containing protein 8 isoform X2 n=1 Tax=Hemitrygon akajei TaxID=2704970 RepID=UPI003BFA0E87